MSFLEKQHIKLGQFYRAISWRWPMNRCVHDQHFYHLPRIDVVERPALNGKAFSDHALQCLAMAPSDSSLTVWLDEDEGKFGIEAKNSQFIKNNESVLSFIKRDNNGLFLYYESVHFSDDAPSGLGAVAFFRAAQAAKAIGLTRIELDAVGGEGYKMNFPGGWLHRYNGYYSWPRFGFDAEITQETRARLTGTSFDPSSTRLLDLMAWDAEWWKKNGAGGPMIFDLASSSRSWHTLRSYLLTKELLR